MKFHALLTYSDPDRDQVEKLIEADNYVHAVEQIPELKDFEYVRLRVLDKVDEDFPIEVMIKRYDKW